MKKWLFFLIIFTFFSLLSINLNSKIYVLADSQNQDLTQSVENQLENLDLSSLENIINTYNKEFAFIENDLKSTLKNIINGEISFDYKNIFNFIFSLLTNNIKNFLPIFVSIIGIGILLSLLKEFNLTKREDISNIINLAFSGFIIIICVVYISKFITLTKETLIGINNQMFSIFPILFTIMTAIGSSKSVTFFQPVIAFVCNFIVKFVINFLLPIVILSLVFTICSNLSSNLKLNKLNNFLLNFFKWCLGLTLTIFMSFVSIQSLTVSTFDSISISAAKFTMRSLIPFVGGFISDSFNIILGGSILIKNALGLTGLILIFSSLIVPIISILCFKFGLEITSGLLEPICDNFVSEFLVKMSKLLTILISIIIVCGIMYLIITATIMSTANVLR